MEGRKTYHDSSRDKLERKLIRQLEKAADLYAKSRFDQILKLYDSLVETSYKSSIYQNLFRMMSLLRLHDPAWHQDYFTAIESGDWEKLGPDDKNYILFYIYPFIAADNASVQRYRFDLALISDETKSFFPLIKGFHPPVPKKIAISISYNLPSSTTNRLWSDSLGSTSRGAWSYATDLIRPLNDGDANIWS